MNKDVKLWNRFAEGYYKKPISDQEAYEHKLEKSREYFSPEMNALEIGCGTGGTALLHAPYLKSILATDISPQMIEIAKARPEFKDIENVTFKAAAVEELNIDDESMDVVFALSLIHLLRDPEKILQSIYKMLKPGGVLISSTVCISDFMPLFKLFGPVFYRLGIFPYVNVFSEGDLKILLQEAGFTIEYRWKREKKDGKDKAVFLIAKK